MENNEFKKVRMKNHACYYLDDIINLKDFGLHKILVNKKSQEKVLIYDIQIKL